MTRDQIVEAARGYLGVRWVHQGREPHGVDCIGLLCRVAIDLGVPYDDLTGYSRIPNDRRFVDHLHKYLTVNQVTRPRHGSVAVIRQDRFPCHVGIFSNVGGVPNLIHSYLPRRKVVEERWVERDLKLVEVLDYPGVQD